MTEAKQETYSFIISDDPVFSKRLRHTFESNQTSQGWKTLVFSNSNPLKDLPLSKLFPFIIKSKQSNIVITIDFETKFNFQLDLLKILKKYRSNSHIICIGIFGEENKKEQLKKAFENGCKIVDYKKPDMEDLINTIMLIKNKEHDFLPVYASSPGNGECLWPYFLGGVESISFNRVRAEMSFSKIDPDEDWINKFVPDLSGGGAMITNDHGLEKKYRWLEDTNKLNFKFSDKQMINSKVLISKKVENTVHDFDKYITPDEYDEKEELFNKRCKEISDDRIRILVLDKELKLMQDYIGKNERVNLFTYPCLLESGENAIELHPHLIAIQWDGLLVENERGDIYEPKNEEKIELLKRYIEKNLTDDVIVIFFGTDNYNIPNLTKKQLNVPFPMSYDFFTKIIKIYLDKGNQPNYALQESVIKSNDLIITGRERRIGVEIPVIIDKLSEYAVTFSSPTELQNESLIEVNYPVTYYLLVLDKFKDKNQYTGIIMGVNEYEKSLIRQEVNRLLRIPVESEDFKEKSDFFRLNTNVLMKKQREEMKKERDLIQSMKREAALEEVNSSKVS